MINICINLQEEITFQTKHFFFFFFFRRAALPPRAVCVSEWYHSVHPLRLAVWWMAHLRGRERWNWLSRQVNLKEVLSPVPAYFAAVLWLFEVVGLFLFEVGGCLVAIINKDWVGFSSFWAATQTIFGLSELSFHFYGQSKYPKGEESLWSKKRLSWQGENVAIKLKWHKPVVKLGITD